jgi:hypothetical protein
MTNFDEEVDVDITYTFTISDDVISDYGFTTQILEWLQANLEALVDDHRQKIFGKVNTGFDEKILKTFGKKPVCDIYINNVEYDADFEGRKPLRVNTIVLYYLKGANNHTYMKACELHDLLLSKFANEESFRRLTDVVIDTYITNSEVRNENIRGGYGVMGAFELSHTLY